MSRKELESQLDNLMALLSSNPDAARSQVSGMGVDAIEKLLEEDLIRERLNEQLERSALERMERTGESFEDALKKETRKFNRKKRGVARADIIGARKGVRDFKKNPSMSQAELQEGVRQDLEFGESAGRLKRADTPEELKRAQLERGFESAGMTTRGRTPQGKTVLDLKRKNEIRDFFGLDPIEPKTRKPGVQRAYNPPDDPEAFLEYKRVQSRVINNSDAYKAGENFRIMKKGNRTFLMVKGPAVVGGKQFNEPRQIFQIVNGKVVQETILGQREANDLLGALKDAGFEQSRDRIQVKSPAVFKQKTKKEASKKKAKASGKRSLKMLRKLPSGRIEALMALLLAAPTLGAAVGGAGSAGESDAA